MTGDVVVLGATYDDAEAFARDRRLVGAVLVGVDGGPAAAASRRPVSAVHLTPAAPLADGFAPVHDVLSRRWLATLQGAP